MDTPPTNLPEAQNPPPPVMQTEPAVEGTLPDPKKSSFVPLLLLGVSAILIVFGASYYLVFMNKGDTAVTDTMQEATNESSNAAMLEGEPADLDADTPSLTTTDTDSDIAKDIDNTTVADESSLYTELDAELQGL